MCKLVMIRAGTYITHDNLSCIFCTGRKFEIIPSSNTDVHFCTLIRKLLDSVSTYDCGLNTQDLSSGRFPTQQIA
jgi:hypothetical protein